MLDDNNLPSLGEFPPGAVPADEPSESAEAWQNLSSDLIADVLEKLDFLEANVSVAEDFQNPVDNFKAAGRVGSARRSFEEDNLDEEKHFDGKNAPEPLLQALLPVPVLDAALLPDSLMRLADRHRGENTASA